MRRNATARVGSASKHTARHLDLVVFNGSAQQCQIFFKIRKRFKHRLFVRAENIHPHLRTGSRNTREVSETCPGK